MISIIVPFYNAEPWIRRCANSLSAQTGDFEFVFVDDGSTDHGADIIREYGYQFKLIDNEHKKGVSGARNTGIERAIGEWVTFVDADDELLPGAYDTFISVIAEDERANMHQLNHKRYYPSIDRLAFKYLNKGGVYTVDNLPKMWFGVWNKLYRREFLEDVRFNEKIQYGEDGLFILECLAKDNYLHHAEKNEVAYKHRFDNKNSLSHVKKEKDLFKYYHELENFIKRQKDPAFRVAGCKILAERWGSKNTARIIGHAE